MISDGPQPPSASVSSFSKSHSVRSASRPAPSTIKTLVNTAPPWARDEPPSPTEHKPRDSILDARRPSDAFSLNSSQPDSPGPSRWWTFAKPRASADSTAPLSPVPQRPARRARDRSLPWLAVSYLRRSQEESPTVVGDDLPQIREPDSDSDRPRRLASRLRIEMPHPQASFTLSQNATPGWETPWTSRPPGQDVHHAESAVANGSHHDDEKLTPWQRRLKRLRAYMLYNTYVPLIFRMVNIGLTAAALALAVRIRNLEQSAGVMGILGSSPTLVVIFASLTLVHVMIAIYLEYFGRPLGLWHTSGKLAYTLSEVVFICAWSAALALAFDNFFTSSIPCSRASSISWYSELPRPSSPAEVNLDDATGRTLCRDQVGLICTVGVGLLMYCSNLFIGLFRIFEKVKYHPSSMLPT